MAQARFWRAVSGYGPALLLALVLGLILAACPAEEPVVDDPPEEPVEDPDPGEDPEEEPTGTLRIYTSVTQDTVDAVTDLFEEGFPEVELEIFRAPTGELNARIAADRRTEDRILADVLWWTDPMSMQEFEAQGDLATWTPANIDVVPEEFRTETFWGTRQLNMILLHGADVEPAPTDWRDLTDDTYEDGVAIPDPEFAGSAFGALAYFALDEEFGIEFYEELSANGAVEVSSIGDVVTGVAEGRFVAGMALDKSAFDARDEGSPIEIVFPEPGAIAMYSPIGIVDASDQIAVAETFVEFVLTEAAQEAIADTGWQPIRDDVEWDRTGPTVTVDWGDAFGQQEEILGQYRAIFGG